MKIGVSTYSYINLVNQGVMTQLDVVKKVKEMGFDFIEFAGLIVPEGESPEEYAVKIKEECDKIGLSIASYTIAADMINGSDGNL